MGASAYNNGHHMELRSCWVNHRYNGFVQHLNPMDQVKSYMSTVPQCFSYAFSNEEWRELINDFRTYTDPYHDERAADFLNSMNSEANVVRRGSWLTCCFSTQDWEANVARMIIDHMEEFDTKWKAKFAKKGFTYETHADRWEKQCTGQKTGTEVVCRTSRMIKIEIALVADIDAGERERRYGASRIVGTQYTRYSITAPPLPPVSTKATSGSQGSLEIRL